MPNEYFQFKQFTVKQDKCAMKVCTDACLFGAWVATHHLQPTNHNVLDIGTGTGLLSLMYAQKNPDTIVDAVEIDEAASKQAKENFEGSSWKERLYVYHTSIQQFAETPGKNYDVITSNPPFYESDLKSTDLKRNLALHSAELKLEELINAADRILNDAGNFFVLIPHYRTKDFEGFIDQKFFIKETVSVQQTKKHAYFRSMLWLIKENTITKQSQMTIMNEDGNYTPEFVALLKDYYLYF